MPGCTNGRSFACSACVCCAFLPLCFRFSSCTGAELFFHPYFPHSLSFLPSSPPYPCFSLPFPLYLCTSSPPLTPCPPPPSSLSQAALAMVRRDPPAGSTIWGGSQLVSPTTSPSRRSRAARGPSDSPLLGLKPLPPSRGGSRNASPIRGQRSSAPSSPTLADRRLPFNSSGRMDTGFGLPNIGDKSPVSMHPPAMIKTRQESPIQVERECLLCTGFHLPDAARRLRSGRQPHFLSIMMAPRT